ncbi:hypothetical protein C1637_20395 [Chryseobacterium lactis]|uniref:VCBS repeat-containing protein n=1 Tax=Chryseobacterium lactis TaxID=1241981 RepID=A0A3G6RLX9_CHRLC|nr:hypothetical protein [Chryseobacterium lactis]AZA82692.1 hypothetical protein EG342_12765 [Chryseobacterium lactis]AZB03074.1 hypothetical protein EG341_03630 [Chryseobacterium lactis]PNW11786.1 hypothetical protein C1637_20395 [Chryseobacterium lactis]
MKKVLFFLSVTGSTFCFAQKEFQPAGSTVIETVDGDLDGDKIPEKVIIYNTKDESESGNIREIQILKKVNGKWTVLEKSRNAILESNAGGMMGDPYQNTEIQKGILMITEAGGSSWKWGHTDKYRFQNGHFELIGYFSEYGKPEEYSQEVDFNLSTGLLNFKKDVENTKEYGPSNHETYIKKGLKINLQNRREKDRIEIILPKTKEKVYM